MDFFIRIFIVMKSWKKFADTLDLTKDLGQDYFDMRKIFQREGWTQEELSSPRYFPQDLLKLHSTFTPKVLGIIQTIKDYGFDVDKSEVYDYITKKLSHIDDITPLRIEDGNNED